MLKRPNPLEKYVLRNTGRNCQECELVVNVQETGSPNELQRKLKQGSISEAPHLRSHSTPPHESLRHATDTLEPTLRPKFCFFKKHCPRRCHSMDMYRTSRVKCHVSAVQHGSSSWRHRCILGLLPWSVSIWFQTLCCTHPALFSAIVTPVNFAAKGEQR